MKYISIDIETTGLDPDKCQILEIGAVIDDFMTPIQDCPTFHCYIRHEQIFGEPFALSMHPTILRRIATCEKGYSYLSISEVACRFYNFLGKCDEKITVAGKNYASFDRRFLSKLPGWDRFIQVRHRVLDPAPLYWRPEIDGAILPDMKTCMERAGIGGKVAHTAVEDARVVALLIRGHYE